MSRRGRRRCATRNEREGTHPSIAPGAAPFHSTTVLVYPRHSFYLQRLLQYNILVYFFDSARIESTSRRTGSLERFTKHTSSRRAHTQSESQSHSTDPTRRATALCWRQGWTHRQPTRSADVLFAHQLARHSSARDRGSAMHFVPQTHSCAIVQSAHYSLQFSVAQ